MGGPTKTIPTEEYKSKRVPANSNNQPRRVEVINGIRSDDPAVQSIPWINEDFVNEDDIKSFQSVIAAPSRSDEDFIIALNDWKPIKQVVQPRNKISNPERRRQRERSKFKVKPPRKDETREGFVYAIAKWPLLVIVMGWILLLSLLYTLTRFYIAQYEYWFNWRGKRQRLRKRLRSTTTYEEWKEAAKDLDDYYNAEEWKKQDVFAYYDYATVRKVVNDLKDLREKLEHDDVLEEGERVRSIEALKQILETSVKSNFAGIENPRLYSQTYYGTKDRLQEFIEESEKCMKLVLESRDLSPETKRNFFKHSRRNYGRTALCLSGGACLSYYHFGVVRALLDQDLLPSVITGTSGGALVAALVGTRTNAELAATIKPELAHKITACYESTLGWIKRWYQTGARFDSVDWARRCQWFTFGSLTFKEAYERTGRVLNVSCIPSDPHSPTMLLNYITAPDCVIWSAVIASAAVPGILNPVVLMMKTKTGDIVPYSFGHKWKDGSLRTDIPLRALNMHFNVNFSVVSQVNPHVVFFFFSSRGTVGRPVSHRKGRGWRGGFLGSALEQYLKLDLAKWLKVLRHLELLPRPASQDWSSVFLQKFDGNVTIWPQTTSSDLYYILTDPTRDRLDRMIRIGKLVTFPKLKFISNRLRIERLIEEGWHKYRHAGVSQQQQRKWESGQWESDDEDDDGYHATSEDHHSADSEGHYWHGDHTEHSGEGEHDHELNVGPSQGLFQRQSQQPPREEEALSPKSRQDSATSFMSSFLRRFSSAGPDGGPVANKDNDEEIIDNRKASQQLHEDSTRSSRRGSNSYQRNLRGQSSRASLVEELGRQGRVFFDDLDEYRGSGSSQGGGSGDEGVSGERVERVRGRGKGGLF